LIDLEEPEQAGAPRLATPKQQPGPILPGSILVVGPGPCGRGGIATVIRMHRMTPTWNRRGLRLLATFDDRSTFHKIRSALTAYLLAPWLLLRADLMHLHLAAQTSILRKLPIVAIARLMRRPIIVHIHAPSPESLFRDTRPWALRFLFRSASRVVALSEVWAATFRAYAPLTRILVLPNPVQIFAPVQLSSAEQPVILFVGKLEPRKGYADLLASAPAILAEFPHAQFWFAGHGEIEKASQQAGHLHIANSIHLLGWVGATSLEAIYRQASLLALPSYAEGVPMSVIEAMSHGIPVVCTPVGGLPELIRDGENGVFVNPGDVPSLARRIIRLLRDPQRAAALARAGHTTVQRHCSIETISEALEALYADVLGEANASS
jgi:glycosyltransferase involved in cell wall biosynthesis